MKTVFFFNLFLTLLLRAGISETVMDTTGSLSEKYAKHDTATKKSQNVRVCFWNVENLYDPHGDSTRQNVGFTSSDSRHWTYEKFTRKLNHIAKTLIAMGKWEPPGMIGLCEIENRFVLNRLVYQTPLARWKYKFIHIESPDPRGMDVALLYRPDSFTILSFRILRIRFPFDTLARTRDILAVKGVLFETDTITVFVNHWPSRLGGSRESGLRRNFVASMLKSFSDSLIAENPLSNILIMGDFNDEPDDSSLCGILQAKVDTNRTDNRGLINLMAPRVGQEGTHKYQGKWSLLDQFIVSKPLFEGTNDLKTGYRQVTIFNPEFLLKEDTRFMGKKPARTYNGPKYEGGFSDHLPIMLDLHRAGSNNPRSR